MGNGAPPVESADAQCPAAEDRASTQQHRGRVAEEAFGVPQTICVRQQCARPFANMHNAHKNCMNDRQKCPDGPLQSARTRLAGPNDSLASPNGPLPDGNGLLPVPNDAAPAPINSPSGTGSRALAVS